MYYIIQENLFKEYNYQNLLQSMERMQLDYEIVKVIPFSDELDFKTDRKDVFCFGALTLSKIAKKYDWNPGSLINDNHDYQVYAPEYGLENMLNGDGVVISFGDPSPLEDEIFFARPTADSKMFSGGLFSRNGWDNDFSKFPEDPEWELVNAPDKGTKILLAPLKEIYQEVRCWVVGGKVVTTSRYKLGSRVNYFNYDDEADFKDFAQSMVDKYQPAEAFVLDVALTPDGMKVVEVNNINSAGFYACNMEKLIMALEDHFN